MLMNKSRMIHTGHVAYMTKMKNAYKMLVGKPERKKPFGSTRCSREGSIQDGRLMEPALVFNLFLCFYFFGDIVVEISPALLPVYQFLFY